MRAARLALLLALAVGVAACGDGDDDAAPATSTTTTTTTSTSVPDAGTAEPVDGLEAVGDALLPTEDTPTVGVSLFVDTDASTETSLVLQRAVTLYHGPELARQVYADASGEGEASTRTPTGLDAQLLDGEGRILISIPVVDTDDDSRMVRFVYTEPIERQLATLRIIRGEEVVLEREATGAAPEVAILQPAEGSRVDPGGFEVTYDVSHPEDVDVAIYVNLLNIEEQKFAGVFTDAPPDRFDFEPLPGYDRLVIADGPAELYVGAFDGTRATLATRPVELG